MEPERWRRVEELYHSALEVTADERAAFLKDACGDDEALRHEVESLLAYERSAEGFVETPALEVAARLMAHDEPSRTKVDPVLTGSTLSHYRVLEKLGGGGMGVVYKAEDLRLGRRVAVKFLPDELASDPAALKRFEREARAASALNHPNICTIHNIEEHEEKLFIVMELLEGQTLRELISAGSPGKPPLEVKKLLDLAVQVTEGLGAAHRQGIVHRDIKPANIFVTTQGQAKILDFGLAKLAPVVTPSGDGLGKDQRDDADPPGAPRESMPGATADPFVSRTGVAMGTAGYMSPEQVRGEKVDARTDLFSFGLVLYEMATGQRAFTGDTAPVLRDAILKHMPTPARRLNPRLPAKLEEIINRALEKDREARYQSVAEMRTELESLRREMEPRYLLRRGAVASGGVAVLLIAGAIFWFAKRQPSSSQTLPDLKLRQLTNNSVEYPVTTAAISPDGKYLAYTDSNGMHLQLIGTGETSSIPSLGGLEGKEVEWEVVSNGWFPDSTRFLANAHAAALHSSRWTSETTSIWVVSVLGGPPRKLRDSAVAYSVSADGSFISLGTNRGRLGEREIWLMGPAGEQARKLFDTGEGSSVAGLMWSPDGQRAIYVQTDESGETYLSRASAGGPPVTVVPSGDSRDIMDASWLPDGRLIYSVREHGLATETCNFWAMRLEAGTGLPAEKPRRLTNWAGFCMAQTSATKDGKQLAFQEWSTHSAAYLASLETGGRAIRNPKRFNMEDSEDVIADWTADSSAVIAVRNRANHYVVYKQSLNHGAPVVIATSAPGSLLEAAQINPDGKWVILQVYLRAGGPLGPTPLMRVPISGGSPELIFPVPAGSGFSCARAPSELCTLAEPSTDRKHLIITAFDPINGRRGKELAHLDLGQHRKDNYSPLFALSPDGTRIAVSRSAEGPIEILSLIGRPAQAIPLKGLNSMRLLGWTGEGKGLFVVRGIKDGTVLEHLDLMGNSQALWKSSGGQQCDFAPSPDGRQLAILDRQLSANMWMMENF